MEMTGNQVVAHNLTSARALRGWTQERAAAELEPYLGERWSKATFSAAERSVTGARIRQFSADELEAFARAFRLPVAYFFMPPGDSTVAGSLERIALAFPTEGVDEMVHDLDERSQISDGGTGWRSFRSHVIEMVRRYTDQANRHSDIAAVGRRLELARTAIEALQELAELEDQPMPITIEEDER